MRQAGLHSGQIFVLISLWNENGQTQIDLSRKLNLTPPTINKMIKSLNNNGFVSTRRSKTDARKVRVFLSDKGNEVRVKVEEQWQNLEDHFFSPLTETEKLILQQVFDKLKGQLLTKVVVEKAS
jgi:DNA-binding MarR family transcriptional regulator